MKHKEGNPNLSRIWFLVYRYMPQEFKDQKKVNAGKSKVVSADTTNIKASDTLPQSIAAPGPVIQEGAFKETECSSCHCYAHQTQMTNNIFIVDFGGPVLNPSSNEPTLSGALRPACLDT
jgi:hypothetical protein